MAYLVAYIISNIAGIGFLTAAVKKTRLARWLFVSLFAAAAWFNYVTVHKEPGIYLTFASGAAPLYARFINSWFAENTVMCVSTIAVGQALIALGMLLKGLWVRVACIGVIVFMAAIAPLGFNSAFPFSITVGIAAFLVYKNDDLGFLMKKKRN